VQRQKWLALLHLIDVETSTRSGSEHVAARVAWRIPALHPHLARAPELGAIFAAASRVLRGAGA
jgi:hypothetical protein